MKNRGHIEKTKEKKQEITNFNDFENELFGEIGTKARDEYEVELSLEIIGEMLRIEREKQEITQEELAKKLGIHKSGVSKVENNTKTQKISTIIRYAKALGKKVFIRFGDTKKDLEIVLG